MSIVITPMHKQLIDADTFDQIVQQDNPIISFPSEGRSIFRGDVLRLVKYVPGRETADFEIIGIGSEGKGKDAQFKVHLKPLGESAELL